MIKQHDIGTKINTQIKTKIDSPNISQKNYSYLIFDKDSKKHILEKRQSLTNGTRKLEFHNAEKMKLGPYLSPCLPHSQKKEVKFKQVNIIPGVSKLLEKKIKMRCTFQVISTGKDFLSRIPEAQEIRSAFDKWDHIKLKSIYIANCQSSEEAAQKTGETFCQLYTWQRSSV